MTTDNVLHSIKLQPKEVVEVDTREGYDQLSATYDATGNPLVAMEDRALSELLGDVRGLKAIDLGCGTGHNSRKLHSMGACGCKRIGATLP